MIVWSVWQFHLLWHPDHTFSYYHEGILGILVTVPPLFAALPVGMLIGNFLFWLFPPARKSLDKVADFNESQKQLLKASKWLAIPTITVSLIAAIF
ncbi:MAG: hypothetical protein A2X56_09260 [Nitrospirae bacterium GWC2_57_13]|nr:MAG: hypothetical protein A2X56_09260 [Nitrospirae bacterium GWC2_57_13]HAR46806.1 hypothetical protein [Nitrospiraceae bacterium]HAS53334.1 hypothetical protein [Nitrospiraceae bacterium]